MFGKAIRYQAVAFSLTIAIVAFLLSGFITLPMMATKSVLVIASVFALVIGALAWGLAERLMEGMEGAVTQSIDRLSDALTKRDYKHSGVAEEGVEETALTYSIDTIIEGVRTSLDAANSMALFDAVTALPNRVHFRAEVDSQIAMLPPKAKSALYFIDLDNFKIVNDTYGHAAGDQLLVMVGHRLREVVTEFARRENKSGLLPIPGRLAGDEFTIFQPSVRNRKSAEELASALVESLNRPYDVNGQRLDVGASVGVALRPDNGIALTNLMRAADVAMYHAKASGRGRAHFYSDDLAAQLVRREQLDQELRQAIEGNEFQFVLQPQIDLQDGTILAAEALLRWQHPSGETRLPGAFLAEMEETGLINALAEWSVIEKSRILKSWAEDGLTGRISSNITHRELGEKGFSKSLLQAYRRQRVNLTSIELEISEHLAMNLSDAMFAELAILRKCGVTISIDNFGKGQSNLARLRELPVDRIKLCPALTRNIQKDADARTIVQGLVGILSGLGLEVVAQGVETSAELELLRVMGCNAAQGFAIAKPMSAQHLVAWTRKDQLKTAARA